MKKVVVIISVVLLLMSSLSIGATLDSLNKEQIKKFFINKTFTSIATDNLNGRTINNTFAMFLDPQGHAFGKMSYKPTNEPQMDQGVYTIDKDGTFYITWRHWDGAKKLCGHFFNTQNAYISVDCDNVFHTAFMKEAMQTGNRLK